MKKTLQNKMLACLLATLILATPQKVGADIDDWIAGQVEQYVREQIEDAIGISYLRGIANSTNSYLGSIGTWLWDNVVSGVKESSMSEKAQKFADYKPDDSALNELNSKYDGKNLWHAYSDVYRTQKTFTKELLYAVHDVRFSELAEGETRRVHQMEIDSLNEEQRKFSPELMTATVKEFIGKQTTSSETKDIFLANLSANRNMAFVVNNHPEVLDVYTNSITTPSLCSNARHLLHWGVTANSHVASLPHKSKLINAREIEFVSENGNVKMQYDNLLVELD